MLTVWGRRSSQNVQKVMWLIGELGLAHEHIDAGGQYGGLDTVEFGTLNPNRKVPVLRDGELILWESHTILRYLAAAYGAGTFWPADPAERALSDRWTDWTATNLQPAFMDVFWGFFRTPPDKRDWRLINDGLERCVRFYGLLDRVLADQPYLGGDGLTMADIPAGCSLYRWHEMGIERPEFPNLTTWYQRLQRRPAYREHVMVSFENLRGRETF